MTQHKVQSLDFGSLPVSLRQELGTYLWHLEQSAGSVKGAAVQILDIRIAYQLMVPEAEGIRADDATVPSASHDELVRRITDPTPRDC